jgi:hypothetical protein
MLLVGVPPVLIATIVAWLIGKEKIAKPQNKLL